MTRFRVNGDELRNRPSVRVSIYDGQRRVEAKRATERARRELEEEIRRPLIAHPISRGMPWLK